MEYLYKSSFITIKEMYHNKFGILREEKVGVVQKKLKILYHIKKSSITQCLY